MNFQGNLWGAVIAVIMLANTVLTLRNGRKTDEVHKVINSQLTEERRARNEQESKLVEATSRASRAEGVLEGSSITTTKPEDSK
jgi:hypothetical protein